MLFVLLFTMNAVMRSSVLVVLVHGWNMESCSSMAASFLPTKRSNHHNCHQQKQQQQKQHLLQRNRRDIFLLRMVVQQQPNIAQVKLEAVPKKRRSSAQKQNPKGIKNTEKIADSPPGTFVTTTTTTTTKVAEKEIKKKRKKRAKRSEEELYWRLDSDEVLFHPSNNDNNNDDNDNNNNNNNNNLVNAATSTRSSSHESTVDSTGGTILATPFPAASWSLLRFTVRGNPVSLQRHRSTHNGRFSYNPSAPAQEAFRNVVQDILTSTNNNNNTTKSTTNRMLLLQPEDAALAVTLIFHRKRPLNHFMSSKRGPDRLKNTAPSFIGSSSATAAAAAGNKHNDDDNDENSSRDFVLLPAAAAAVSIFQSDVDNLAKFVLDALNGFLYVDDKQIISLTAIKVWDNDDECLGSTSVCLRVLKDQYELESFIREQQQQAEQ